ncbi:hypothetical protein H2198_000432 [Neophaeococcomyces mojaviensis]|uniref:Uncharacterized protein n=1 Tax=Neophaeococcomyces mojaviensis TaxID=3383035 RepID=A0ACC3AKW9_9EURO|nr:hypothetical protein H2198_000432 [Knufia sp. JES_112]
MPLTGHCNCKAVTITVDDSKYTTESESSLKSIYCHCTTCKRQSGASGTFVIIADDNEVKIDDPKGAMKSWKDTLTDSGTPLDRNFCGICGCPLTTITPLYAGKTIVKMGLFDTIPPAAMEIYCKNKQKWEPDVAGVNQVHGSP